MARPREFVSWPVRERVKPPKRYAQNDRLSMNPHQKRDGGGRRPSAQDYAALTSLMRHASEKRDPRD
eukprot:4937334-Prymnesium_polylepis.1